MRLGFVMHMSYMSYMSYMSVMHMSYMSLGFVMYLMQFCRHHREVKRRGQLPWRVQWVPMVSS